MCVAWEQLVAVLLIFYNETRKSCVTVPAWIFSLLRLARRPNPNCDTADIALTTDIFAVASNPDIDILVELIGGYDTALDLIKTAISHGKHIVTANKALIAEHGDEIFAPCQRAWCCRGL